MNQEVPHKKTNRDKKKGMYSTLFVLITSLCTSQTQVENTLNQQLIALESEFFWNFCGVSFINNPLYNLEKNNIFLKMFCVILPD